MNVHHLRYFVATARHGSFAKAGAVLKMSPSPLGRRVRDLERYLGYPVFRRTPHGAELTPAGRRLLPVAMRLLTVVAELDGLRTPIGRPPAQPQPQPARHTVRH